MNDYTPDTREPLKVVMYGDGFASLDGAIRMTAFGRGALQTLAKKLLRIGYDPAQKLDIHRGGKRETLLTLHQAAK
jgi:hypothetical protein